MTNENLNIQFGTVNTLPTVCFLKASLKIRLFFQFTDTITSKATQLLSNSISTNLAIQNQETFTFKALDPGSNQVVSYSKSYIFTKKLRASFKYAKHIIVKFSGTANDYATINLNLGGNNYNYQSNASYYFAGCYSSVKPDGSFVDFVNYNLDQNINFNNNQVNVKITQHGTCSLWTDISVQGSILVQYKQFTDTIRTTLNSFSTLIRQDLIIGRIVIMIGDDNSDCFKGTWNTDFSVKTVTRATGSIASPISACDLVFFAQNNLQNDSSTGVYYSNGKIGVISAVTNNFKPSIDKPIPTLVYYNYRNFSNPSYYYWYQNRSVLTNLSVLNGTYNFTFDFDYLGKHYSIKKRMIISYQFTNTVKTSVSTFSANLNNSIQLVNIYTIKGSNVAECHVFDIVDVWKLLYILDISVKSNNIEKAYITATLTAEGDDEFIFKLNNSYNMSLPSNAGSCMTCSACGNYTNFYKNSTKTFDVTQYLQDTNSIYVYFHNFTGGYSYKISNLEFTIKTYSKLQFTSTVKLSSNSSYATINKDIPVGYFFTNLGDDNSDALRGTWNADRTVKTVTSSTADWSDYLISGADIVFLNSDIHDGLTCLKFSDGRNVNIPQNFEVTIDKMIPFYEYHQGNDDPSFPTHRKDGYYFYLTISPIWFTSFSNANILLSNRNNMNGSYNFTFKFNYNNKDYSFKKTLVISF